MSDQTNDPSISSGPTNKNCKYCGGSVPAFAIKCSHCGEFIKRKVGIGLGIGVALIPAIFSWFTLRKGHSTLSRIIAFGWMVLSFSLLYGPRPHTDNSNQHQQAQPSSVASQEKPLNNDEITLEKFIALKTGMSYDQVVKILGAEGEIMSENEMMGVKTSMYQWRTSGFSNMNAMFQGGKLVQKAQFGLK